MLLVVSAVAGAAPSSVSRVFAPAHHPTSHALLSTNPSGHLNLFSGTVATAAQFEGDDGDLVPQTMTDWNSFAPVTWTGTAPNQTTTKVVAPWTFYGVTDARGSVDGPPDSTYAGGVKQADECPAIITTGNNASTQNKDDLARIYIAGKVDPNQPNHVFLALAWVRAPQQTTSSDVHVAFEFNQSTTACGAGSDSLVHRTLGDLLIVYNFQSGVPSLAISAWDGTTWGTETTLTSTVANAAVFTTAKSTTFDALKPLGAPDPGTDEFGEAILDLTQAQIDFGTSGRTCERFGRVFGESRSSGSSTSAQMEDLVGPVNLDLSTCVTPTIATTPSAGGTVGATTLNDTATLTGGNSPTGTITFNLYGPSDTTCSGTPLFTQAVAVANGGAATSNGPTANTAGTYHWTASYSGDGNNNSISSGCADEPVVVNKATPTLSTTASGPVVVGGNIHDTAHLGGGFGTLTGTITFSVYAPGDTTCSTPLTPAPGSANVSSGAGDYNSGDFATTNTGVYRWIAHYSGDGNNNSVDTACNDANESSTVNKATPTLSTTASGPVVVGGNIHDTAHLGGGFGTLTGTITFSVYAPGDTTCSTPLTPAPGSASVSSGAGDYASGDFATSAVGEYRWIAHYSGDDNNNAVNTACNDANESSTVTKATPTLTTTASGPVVVGGDIHDTAHLAGGFGTLTGTITFSVYAPGDTTCATPLTPVPGSANVSSGAGDYASGNFATSLVGDYRWIAHYSGDGNNNGVDTACNDANESSTVNKATPTLTTTASGPVTVGADIHDTAHLAGGFGTLTGTITFSVYGPGDTTCATPLTPAPGSANVTSGAGDYASGPFATTAAGDYRWIAHYSGDAKNNAVDTACNDANETSTANKATPTLTTTASGPVVVGGNIHDTAHLAGGFAPLTGTITFSVYAPGDTTCQTALTPAPGSATVDNGAGDYASGDFATSAVGNYRWIAHYSGDGNNNAVDTACNDANESSTVNKATPTLSTTASGPVPVGGTIHDTAHLAAGFGPLTGTITFSVYGPGDTTCATPLTPAPGSATVDNGAGDYASGDFTANAAGDYRWIAHYSGDANNNAVDTACNDANETSSVGKANPSIKTTLSGTEVLVGTSVHDSAALTGATANAGGTVTYSVYTNNECSTGKQDAGTKTVTNGNVPDSNALAFPSAGTFYWQAVYSGDANNNGATSACLEEQLAVDRPAISITKNPKTQVIEPGAAASFSITVTNTGSVTLTDVTVTDALAPGCAKSIGTLAAGASSTYTCSLANVTASFTNSATATGKPPVGPNVTATDTAPVVVKNAPTLSTTLSSTEVLVGTNVHDTAKLTGATASAGGTVTYSVFSDSACSLGKQDAGTKTVTNGNVPDSNALTFGTAGTFYWQAAYSGDTLNDAATSKCTEEQLAVDRPAISIAKTPKSQAIDSGGSASFHITVTNTGTVTLTDVTVADILSPACAKVVGTLAPGASSSYDCGLAGVTAPFTNSATATGHPPVGPDVTATDTAAVTVNAVPPPPPPPPAAPAPPKIDLAITKAGLPTSSVLGSQITWTMTVTNNGPDTATGVKVADPVPAGTTFVSATSTVGTCTTATPITCSLGTMAKGATVTITLVTTSTATGTIANTATVVGNEAETNTANNTANASVSVTGPFTPPPAVCTALGVSPKQLLVGKKNTLTMRVSQNGKPTSGVKVRIKGSTIAVVTAPSNSKGVVKHTIKPMKAGIITFVPVAQKSCKNPRVGVIGVFTPPVTG